MCISGAAFISIPCDRLHRYSERRFLKTKAPATQTLTDFKLRTTVCLRLTLLLTLTLASMVTLTLALIMAHGYNLRLKPRKSNNAVPNFIFENVPRFVLPASLTLA